VQVIGITGEKQSGKSTVAASIQETLPDTPHVEISDIVTEVANDMRKLYVPSHETAIVQANDWLQELPDILERRINLDASFGDFVFTEDDVRDRPNDYASLLSYTQRINEDHDFLVETIDHGNKEKHRAILQALGAAVVAAKPDAWYREAFRRLEQKKTSRTRLGVVSTVAFESDADYVRERGGVIAKVIRSETEVLLNRKLDPTDRERAGIKADIIVHNNGYSDQLIKAGSHLVSIVQMNEFPATIVCSEL
jgi:hypothetical protein